MMGSKGVTNNEHITEQHHDPENTCFGRALFNQVLKVMLVKKGRAQKMCPEFDRPFLVYIKTGVVLSISSPP